MRDIERFLKNIVGLAETFREPTLSQFRIEAYRRAMERFDDDEIERAILEAATTLRFFPKPVELVELITGTGDDLALRAWELLQQAISRCGPYKSVHFLDAKIARVVQIMGGWIEVNAWVVDELHFRRQEFVKAYKALPVGGEPITLIGITERDNAARGFLTYIPAPVVIGTEEPRCQRIEASTGR